MGARIRGGRPAAWRLAPVMLSDDPKAQQLRARSLWAADAAAGLPCSPRCNQRCSTRRYLVPAELPIGHPRPCTCYRLLLASCSCAWSPSYVECSGVSLGRPVAEGRYGAIVLGRSQGLHIKRTSLSLLPLCNFTTFFCPSGRRTGINRRLAAASSRAPFRPPAHDTFLFPQQSNAFGLRRVWALPDAFWLSNIEICVCLSRGEARDCR
jgi:hypothetical protein